jgi:probable phosphoglycerate mutase
MALFFLRHGQCQANLDDTFAGATDNSPLTTLGRAQAEAAARNMQGLQFAAVISSPLDRALDTAKIVAARTGISPVLIQTDQRLLERDMGAMGGKKKSEAPAGNWNAIQGLESSEAFRTRVLDFFREHKADMGNTLVVSHAGVASALEAARRGLAADQFFTIQPPPNGEMVRLDLSWLPSARNAASVRT